MTDIDKALSLFDDVRTLELDTIFEHTFQKVPEDAGNGITDKFWEYSGVTRDGPDVVVPEGAHIQTKETGDYRAGQPSLTGGATAWNQQPVGDEDSYLGYYNRDTGVGGGLGYRHFDEGEEGASSSGPQLYAFLQSASDSSRRIVPQEDWNINRLNGDADEGPEVTPTDGIMARFPHACYGHTLFVVAVGVKKDETRDVSSGHLRSPADAFRIYPVHAFIVRGEAIWDNFDLSFLFETTGTEGTGFAAEATACHYEAKKGRSTKRQNGEAFTVSKNDGSTLSAPTYPDWQYVMSFRKRADWESVNVQPTTVALNATQDVEVQITVGADLSNTAYSLPEDTPTTETAVEYDLVGWDIDAGAAKATDTTVNSRGEREWLNVIPSSKDAPINLASTLDDVVLTGGQPVSLFVRSADGSNQAALNYAVLGNGGGF